MSIENTVCKGCPAAFALGLYTQELADKNGGFKIEARRAEAIKAHTVLESAAGKIACKDIDKQLPELPDAVPPTGSDELISFVSQCPSFAKYIERRQAEIN